MKCHKCQYEIREGAGFCSECGHKFELICPTCKATIIAESKFCDACGCNLRPLKTAIGDFPPTNRKIEVQYCSVMQIKNGKVICGRDYYDASTILRQLGLES